MEDNIINIVTVLIVSVIIVTCSIGIIVASTFQQKKKKKYNEFLKILEEKNDSTFQVKDYLTKDEINKIDSEIDVDLLMKNLYETYLTLENKMNTFDDNLDEVLTGYLKDFYINKIENFKEKNFADIKDRIELVGYCITEFKKEALKFRVTINCLSYKMINNKIVSGSNLDKVQEILLLSYKKIDDKWLIESYEKIYEKKLSN